MALSSLWGEEREIDGLEAVQAMREEKEKDGHLCLVEQPPREMIIHERII
jgi:hypothetical protein